MDFFKLIQSLDELVYEVLGWLLFFPRTVGQLVIRPVTMMLSAETELADDEEHQFDDLIAPPLFLALVLALIHVVELQVVGQDAIVTSKEGFAKFISNDTNLLVLRIVMFGLLPLTVARRLLKIRKMPVNKRDLKAPFYAQCYAAAIYAVILNGGIFLTQAKFDNALKIGVIVGLLGIGWFLIVETIWFRRKEAFGWARAFWNALVSWLEWLAVLLVLFALMGR